MELARLASCYLKVGEEMFKVEFLRAHIINFFFPIGWLTAWNEEISLVIQGLPIGRVGNYFMRVFLQLWSDKRMKQTVDAKIARYPNYDIWVCEFSIN